MKKIVFLAGAVVVLLVPMASANPIPEWPVYYRPIGANIAWGTDCWADNPVNSATFACNKNTGSHVMWISFVPPTDLPEFLGVEARMIGVAENLEAIPDWWNMSTEVIGCRSGSVTGSADFTSAPQITCQDPWGGAATGGLSSYVVGEERMDVTLNFVLAEPVPLSADVQYYACRMTVLNNKTVGTGACAGCMTPVLWLLEHFRVVQATGSQWLTTALPEGNGYLLWQGVTPPVGIANASWGRIKSLYR